MDESLGLIEHLPEVQELFHLYSCRHFEGLLGTSTGVGGVEWSDRMTQCAGTCTLKGTRSNPAITIRLSRPLLQFRPFSDTINTLLHEMIHAYFFLKQCASGRFQLDRDGHGPDFQALAAKINAVEGSEITVYHSFHAEVGYHRRHVWRCNGACRERPPFFGWVRRAMNRKPQAADSWWSEHRASCSGEFIKVAGPDVKEEGNIVNSSQSKVSTLPASFYGEPRTWGSLKQTMPVEAASKKVRVADAKKKTSLAGNAKITAFFDLTGEQEEKLSLEPSTASPAVLKCPCCDQFSSAKSLEELNAHVDSCLQK